MKREKFEYKNNFYYLEGKAEMKNEQTREWQKCVIYYSAKTGARYVREETEFFERFKKVEDDIR